MQMGEDARKLRGKELESARKARAGTVVEALERGLGLPDAKGKASMEANNARAMPALCSLSAGKYPGAVQTLWAVTPAYPSYALARYQLAQCAFEAERGGAGPLPGDKAGDYRARALKALDAIPATALGGDPATNRVYLSAKAQLGRE